ncbi:rhodanese-like domain-containing protein [Lentzea nigeriaca]|uniref:rhodanese-like domain-containing protein n=1 Tax=Lentzea nigeriaca TaxID=1128665 RepID=UPI00195897FB|nr:rhodanese-like domain-containing protein [Lentzea nigeriaca]MBM7864985.1 rhodanese-related sulfurtransferase [Lentzea nigeriaca]
MATLHSMIADARATVPGLDPVAAKRDIDAGRIALVLDVREPEESARGRIPGAVTIPRGWLELRADPASPAADPVLTACRDRTILVYCRQAPGVRSLLGAQTLRQLGYSGAAVLDGGLAAWAEAGLPVEEASVAR